MSVNQSSIFEACICDSIIPKVEISNFSSIDLVLLETKCVLCNTFPKYFFMMLSTRMISKVYYPLD